MNSSKVLVSVSTLTFALPLVIFAVGMYQGSIDSFFLWFSATQLFYSMRFIDMEVIAKPTWGITKLLSALFLTIGVIASLSAFYSVPLNLQPVISALFSFGFFFLFGIRAMMIHDESASALRHTHPAMFFETKQSAYYNMSVAFLLSGFTATNSALSSQNFDYAFFSGYASLMTNFASVALFVLLLKSTNEMRKLKKNKEGRRLLTKVAEDKWDAEVSDESIVGRTMGRLLIPVCILLLYVGVFGLWIATNGAPKYWLPWLFTVFWAATIFSYSLRRSGLGVKALLRVARGSVSVVPHLKELRDRATFLISFCGFFAAGAYSLIQFMPPLMRNATIVSTTQVTITQASSLYADLMALGAIVVFTGLIRFNLVQELDSHARRRFSQMFHAFLLIAFAVTGGMTGSTAFAFGVPLIVDAAISSAWIVSWLLLTYYIAYLRGGKNFEKYWEARVASVRL
jgi:hypothetical protein